MLTQNEANALITMGKMFAERGAVSMPPGVSCTWKLDGVDEHEKFLLDIRRNRLRLSKLKHQVRARKCIVLVRLDIDSSPHTNPDGKKIGGTHIHIYREEYESKWAYPVPSDAFRDLTVPSVVFADFCNYCNILNPPPLQQSLQ